MTVLHVSNSSNAKVECFVNRLAAQIWPPLLNSNFYLAQYVLEKARLFWISFECSQGKFVLAVYDKRLNVFAAVRLVRFLNEEFNLKFVLNSENFEAAEIGSFDAYKFINGYGRKLLLAISKSLPEPRQMNKQILKHLILTDVYRDTAGTYMLCNGKTVYVCSYEQEKKILECKERIIMDTNVLIEAAIKIGSLQFKLEDLLSLQVGSQINFDLQQSLEIELEVGGSLFAKGSLGIDQNHNAAVVLKHLTSETLQKNADS